jgi:murein DD-endopeptidase MepM/ murein hydrolase activator NlpD
LKPVVARGICYAVITALAYAALHVNPPIPHKPAERLRATPASARAPLWRSRTDTLASGETLLGVLGRGGVRGAHATAVLRAARAIDQRRVLPGLPITFGALEGDSVPARVTFRLAVDRILHVDRGDSGWVASEQRLPWTRDTIAVSGTITSSLYAALDAGAADLLPQDPRHELAWTLADIYEYRIDMSRDLQAGDSFRALVERERGPEGIVRIGEVLAASFALSGTEIEAVRFSSASVSGEYFDAEGKSLRAGFLRAPLAFRRISSGFGARRHPVLGVWRQHKGTDYAAASGTPVRAVGDGVVIFAGRRGGYGNAVEVRHRNGYISRYGHLRGFARGIRSGRRVGIAETVGYVGQTGLATGPHLHFEVLVGGVQRDPRVALRQRGGDPIPARERGRFQVVRQAALAALERAAPATRLASR